MKELASKHYSHLDTSEPIPRIEPRYNEAMHVMYEAFTRIAPWAIGALFVVHFRIGLAVDPEWARIAAVIASWALVLAFILWRVIRAYRIAGFKWNSNNDDPWGVPIGLDIRFALYFLLFSGTLGGFAATLAREPISAIFYLSWFVFLFGAVLVVYARFARQPGQISCLRCDYPLAGLVLPCACPECGHAIVDLSHATDRPRVRDARILVVGIVLVVLAGSIGVLRFVSPGAVYAPIPRATLLQLAPADEHAFNQLMTTIISPEEERQLFEAMIAKRIGFDARGGYEQEDWVGSKIAQGWLTREELGALYIPATEVRIRAPKRARVGEPVRLLIEGDRVRLPSGAGFTYFFAGFFIDDDTTPLGRTDTPKYRTFLVDPERETYLRNGYIPIHTWTPTEPGAYTIRARLVFAIAPGLRIQSQIDWSAQGDARFPTPPLWTHEVELEHTITVLE